MRAFPSELILQIFPHLTLKSLIAARGVNQEWQQLVPLSDIALARRALLDLYLDIVSSPYFEQTRPWALANLRPFDRQAYLDALLKQHDCLPEAFRLWILEWPACAVVGCAWPGLPRVECGSGTADGVERLAGLNWLGYQPPQVSVMAFLDCDEEKEFEGLEHIPGLLVWSGSYACTWLVLEGRECLHGKVYVLAQSMNFIMGIEGDDYDEVYSDWIEWQRHLWKQVERAAKEGKRGKFGDEGGWETIQTRPVLKAWSRRQEPGYLD
jgi:hypothetical protein